MSSPKDWGRISLDNEIVTLHSIKRDSHGYQCWQAEGKIDGEIVRVPLYNEHKRAIGQAGYNVRWGKPQIVVIDAPTVSLIEHNGRRRIAAVLKLGTDDEWIEVKQK